MKNIGSGLRPLLLLLNAVFWIYFWISFAIAARSDDPRFCIDHCHPAYGYFGHGIGYNSNPHLRPFMKLMVGLEMPSFVLTKFSENLLSGEPADRLLVDVFGDFGRIQFPGHPNLVGGMTFAGITVDGYQLIATMLLSFIQWALIATCLRWFGRVLRKSGVFGRAASAGAL